jgi:predicted nucleotidyltransferase
VSQVGKALDAAIERQLGLPLHTMPTRIESLRADQLGARKAAATQAAARALERLRARGIEASVIGSLKTGAFGQHSDIDILVTKCPSELVYTVEAELEDIMAGLPFDVVYLELLPEDQRAKWLEHAR